MFVKALPFAGLVRGLSKFVEEDLEGLEEGWGERESGGEVARAGGVGEVEAVG